MSDFPEDVESLRLPPEATQFVVSDFPEDVESLRLTPEMHRAIETVRKLRKQPTDAEIAEEIYADEILRDIIDEIHAYEELDA